jgi:hypothetical protein
MPAHQPEIIFSTIKGAIIPPVRWIVGLRAGRKGIQAPEIKNNSSGTKKKKCQKDSSKFSGTFEFSIVIASNIIILSNTGTITLFKTLPSYEVSHGHSVL